ncbi:MAG TPA: hypothetical protein V6D03_11750 [Candidatus Caenarcaniphilales bacterium]
MHRKLDWLQKTCLRQIVPLFLIAITFLVIPAFSGSELFQAQAEILIAKIDPPIADKAAAKRVIDEAEDHVGDRPIGDTGLKNIKELGDNIPETSELVVRQRSGIDQPATPEAKSILENVQDRIEGVFKGTK